MLSFTLLTDSIPLRFPSAKQVGRDRHHREKSPCGDGKIPPRPAAREKQVPLNDEKGESSSPCGPDESASSILSL